LFSVADYSIVNSWIMPRSRWSTPSAFGIGHNSHPVTRCKIGGDHRFGARRGHIRLERHHHAIFAVPRDHGVEQVVIDAATVCPGECIFIEEEAWYDHRGSS